MQVECKKYCVQKIKSQNSLIWDEKYLNCSVIECKENIMIKQSQYLSSLFLYE